jgi:hypothetical protein
MVANNSRSEQRIFDPNANGVSGLRNSPPIFKGLKQKIAFLFARQREGWGREEIKR